ncbi:MAG: condensation domain-containing protein, partial [Gemmatimonadaceae bacterium]
MTDANEAGRETPRSTNLSARLARLSPEQRATFDRLLRERGKAAEATGLTRFTRSSRASAEPARTSYAQERLWFWEQLRPGQSSYNVSAARRMIGVLDVAALRSALGTIVARHESLRTTIFEWQGEPRQIVAPPVPVDALSLVVENEPVHDPATTTWLDHAIREPFDLATGVLYRVRLWRCGPREHVLLIVMHHAISDGSSFGVLWHELELLYAAYTTGADAAAATALPSLPIQYADYAEWQRVWMAGGELDRQLAYWRHHLEDAPKVLTLPTDRPRLAAQQFRGGRRVASLETALVAELRSLARNENATLFIVLLAGFEALVARYSGQSDFLIGVPMTNRPRPELQALIGFFVNMLPMRASVPGAATGRDLVRRVRATATDAYAHQDIPFERLVDALQPERDLSRMPLVQVAFQLQSFGIARPSLAGLTTQVLETWNGQARFDLEVSAVEDAATDDVRLTVVYDTDLFDASTIDRLCRHYEAVLAALASAPDASVADIPLLSAAERMQL